MRPCDGDGASSKNRTAWDRVSDACIRPARAADALAREVTDTTRQIWARAKPKIVRNAADGLGAMAKPAVVVGVASLMGSVFGPLAGLTALLAGFGKIGSLAKILKKYLPADLPPEE